MGIAEWVIVAVVALGVVVALFGWDRTRSNRKGVSESSQPTSEVFADPASGKPMRASGTTQRQASGSTVQTKKVPPEFRTVLRRHGRRDQFDPGSDQWLWSGN